MPLSSLKPHIGIKHCLEETTLDMHLCILFGTLILLNIYAKKIETDVQIT